MSLTFSQGVRVESIQNREIKSLFEYWQALSPAGSAALKDAFDPTHLPCSVWPRLFMIDVPAAGGDYRFRLLGTYIVGAVGRDFTGNRLIEPDIPGIARSVTFSLLMRLTGGDGVQHYVGPPSFPPSRRFSSHEQLILPLHDGEGRVNAVIGGIDYLGFTTAGLFSHAYN